MNWKRIWTGTLAAGIVVFLLDGLINHVILIDTWRALRVSGQLLPAKFYTVPSFAVQDLAIGFILTWLYALARPRLGPGPKTAIVMGSIAGFLIAVPHCLFQWLWLPLPLNVTAVTFVGAFIQAWAGTYVAGWQYIEKAP